jgi:hypothetical protein
VTFSFRRFAACLLQVVTLSFALFQIRAASPPSVELANRSVAMTLVKSTGLSPVAWPDGRFSLAVSPMVLAPNSNIYSVLLEGGIVPDAEAFTLVYDLNPDVRSLGSLQSGSLLQLPKIDPAPELLQLKRSGYLVQLAIDAQLREELNEKGDQFQLAAASFKRLPPDRFVVSAKRSDTQQQVETLAKWYAQIKRSYLRHTGPPLRRQTLVQLRDELSVLESLVAKATNEGQKVTETEQDQITAIYKDVEIDMKKYGETLGPAGPQADALVNVVVNIKGQDLAFIQGLRVYYTVNGIFRDPPVNPPVVSYGFKQLGSGKSEALPIKNYRMWAARDGDPSHPLTPPLLVQIFGTQDSVPVDLSLAERNR